MSGLFPSRSRPTTRHFTATIAVATASLLGVACGDDSDDSTGSGGSAGTSSYQVPELPELEGPIAGPGTLFIDGLEQNLLISVEDLGYVFEEYFVSGTAAGNPYRVRLLVTRPGPNGPPLSGDAIVEPKHPTSQPFVWYFTREYLAPRGHAAFEISTFPETVETTLKGANPERYADLHVAEEQTSDIFAQVGALLKSDQSPLPGTERLYMTGHSRAAGPTWHFMDTHHHEYRLSGGAPIYDGFFPETTRTASRFGKFPDVDVPTVLINSQLEVEIVLVQEKIDYRKPDSDHPGRQFRLYEIAGMEHNPSWKNPVAVAVGIGDACDNPPNAFPYEPTISMALDHLIRWVAEGVAPPRGERIALVGAAESPTAIARDEHGNALGGIRSTTLDVPVATYDALNTPESCLVFGSQHTFPKEKLEALYGDHAAYVNRVEQRLQELVDQGWFLPDFAEATRAEAQAFTGFD